MSFLPMARLVPRACATERVGDDVVTLDEERLHYHAMHERVFDVLTLSDGTRSVDAIAMAAFGSDDAASRDLTGQALLDLMDAGLVVDDADAREWFMSRRAVAKIAAGVVLGVVGLPLVKSITAPDAASAISRCGNGGYEAPCDNYAGNGCLSCCCCGGNGANAGLCRPPSECDGLSGYCI